MSQNYNIDFNPVQCTSNTFKNLTPQDGFLYFVTDTKQLFLARDNAFINMCGGINIYYGVKKIEYENSGQAPDPHVVFQIHELEGEDYPLPNDLILNSDGCFYRVESVADEDIATIRLTLQGTGGGGSIGGGGGAASSSYSINVTPQSNIFSSQSESMDIYFQGIAAAQTETYINRIAFSIGAPESETNPAFYVLEGYYTIGTLSNPVKHHVNLIDYKDLFGASATTVYLNTTDVYGLNLSKKFSVSVVDLTLASKENNIFKSSNDLYSYTCAVGGAKTGISNKKLVLSIYSEDNLNSPVVPEQIVELPSNYTDSKTCELNLKDLNHGVYVLKVQMVANIAGSEHRIYSNVLTHKLIRFVSGSPGALLAVYVPDKIEQYTNSTLDYMIASEEVNKNYTVDISIDGVSVAKLATITDELKSYTLYFENKGNYTLNITVVEMSNLSETFSIQVIEYSGELPVIDPSDPMLMLYLNPRGRSNDAIDRDQWEDYNKKHTAKLQDVYYSKNSGWLEDENGVAYLQLTSGGKLTVPGFKPFKEDPTRSSNLNSAMGKGMTIELDFEVNGITDYNAELIKCISKNDNKDIEVGFSINGNKAYFYSHSKNGGQAGALTNINLIEGKRIRLSFVLEPNDSEHPFPMCLTYIDGKISGATIYSTQDSFVDSIIEPAELIIDSRYAQIKIYSIKFYSRQLTDSNILSNYTASLASLDERQDRFDSNNVYDDFNNISFEDVSAENYDLKIPYMTIVGGWACDENNKWNMLPSDKIGPAALPGGKKDYRLIDVSVTYPKYEQPVKDNLGNVIIPAKNEYFKGYQDYSFKNTFANGLGMTENFGSSPNNGGCIMYAQGTSSMEYPVKNLRIRFRNENDFFTVRPDIAPVEIICMKADYMESSGSHNTGAANLVDDLYSGAGMKTPGQAHFGPADKTDTSKKTIVTCIKGHPCLIFWSPTGEKGSFQYVGKYNLNLDKATPEPFGFNHDDNFGWLAEGDKYWQIQYGTENKSTGTWEDVFIGQTDPTEGGDYVPHQVEAEAIVQPGEKINAIHCFEFLDNAVPVCNFMNRPRAYVEDENGNLVPDPEQGYFTYEETWYNGFDAGKGKIQPGWTFGFESRYPEDRIGYHDADMLYPLASWLNELHYLKTEGSNRDGNPSQDDIALANLRFKDEYQRYLDKNFLLFYYIVTEALLMADNRVKNMMIATWGKEHRTFVKSDGTQDSVDGYIWYPIFYDMDTMLGLDNTGVNRFKYYDEDNNPSTYNGEEVLWNFVRDNLQSDLDAMYNSLEPAGLNITVNPDGQYSGSSLIPYFNNNQANMANEAFYNGDTKYKYIRPAIEGYYDGLNEQQIAPGVAPYLYAAQGDRSLNREHFITNRIKYLRGKRGSQDFQTKDRITFRLYCPTGLGDEFKETIVNPDGTTTIIDHKDTITYVKPSDTFEFESLQTCYAGVLVGANNRLVKERFEGEQKKQISVPESKLANGTEAYLLGVSNLKDLGDLSTKYPQKFIMGGSESKFRTLTFGNPHKDYYNPYWRPDEGSAAAIQLNGCSYLQNFNLQNCKTYNAHLDFSPCPVIETILLTGSSVSDIKLPVNGMLKQLRLPTTVSKLTIDSHPYLNKDGFSIGTYNYDTSLDIKDQKIGAGRGSYVNDYTYLTHITVVDTPIDSYDMVSQAVVLNGYYFEGFDWEIKGEKKDDQYIKTSDIVYDNTKTYYIWDYVNRKYDIATKEQFNNDYSRIKEKYSLIENGRIVRIPILDQLYIKSPMRDNKAVTKESALTGVITIKAPARVNQFEIYKMYNGKYPNVKIEYDEEAIGTDNLEKAFQIEFFNAPGVDANTEPYYTVLTDGSYTLADLISAEGPAGVALVPPTMQSTNNTVFTFSGKWKVVDLDNPNAEEITYYDMNTDFANIIPGANLKLEPVYNSDTRYYKIKFFDHNSSLHVDVDYTYEQIMSTNKDTPMYLHRDEKLENEYERYAFKGWIAEKDFNNLDKNPNPKTIVLEEQKVTFETSYYPLYVIEDARTTPTSLQFFDIIAKDNFKYTFTQVGDDGVEAGDGEINLGTQYIISVKPAYRETLAGKITLPNKDAQGHDITVVGVLGASNITEIYFLENNKYISIGTPNDFINYENGGFYNLNKLTKIYFPATMTNLKYIGYYAFGFVSATIENLPDTIEYIEASAFKNCQSELNKIPPNVTYIGGEAYRNAINATFTTLPANLKVILPMVFYSCPRLEINNFGYDTNAGLVGATDNQVKIILQGAFFRGADECGKNVTDIYLKNSIIFIGPEAFSNYGNSQGITLHDESGLINDENEASIFGTARPVTRA